MSKKLICFQYQCPRHPQCDVAGGKCCGIEFDPEQEQLPAGACSAENGYPYFRPVSRQAVLQWMRNPLSQS